MAILRSLAEYVMCSCEAHAHLHEVPLDKAVTSGGIPLSEVAHHNKPHDCWIAPWPGYIWCVHAAQAINKNVYDLTDFLIHHPEQRNSILAWAGRDASSMWDKIPGRFPSKQWMEFFMRPEWKMGDVVAEAPVDPEIEQLKQLHHELRRLEGPSKEDIAAAKTAVKVPARRTRPLCPRSPASPSWRRSRQARSCPSSLVLKWPSTPRQMSRT